VYISKNRVEGADRNSPYCIKEIKKGKKEESRQLVFSGKKRKKNHKKSVSDGRSRGSIKGKGGLDKRDTVC